MRPVREWGAAVVRAPVIQAVTVWTALLVLAEIGFLPEDLPSRPDPYRLETFGKVGGGVSQPSEDHFR